LDQGDALGILGTNGSGKTTLLRILNGTFPPDIGCVSLRGKVGALIAAGAGFSPVLTGRENIFISGSLLGMTPGEVRKSFDEIVDFAELTDHIDVPVKNYSSGMTVRLGFAIAVMDRPDLLLVDEVLAVGDMAFQRKCFDYINRLRDNGTTIILVSHSPSAIWAVCNWGLVLDKGSSGGVIQVEEACRIYEDLNAVVPSGDWSDKEGDSSVESSALGIRGGDGSATLKGMKVLDARGCPTEVVDFDEPFKLRLMITSREPLGECMLRVVVNSPTQKAIGILDNYETEGRTLAIPAGDSTWEIDVPKPRLRPGVYEFGVSLVPRRMSLHIAFDQGIARLAVRHPRDRFLYADFRAAVYLDALYRRVDG